MIKNTRNDLVEPDGDQPETGRFKVPKGRQRKELDTEVRTDAEEEKEVSSEQLLDIDPFDFQSKEQKSGDSTQVEAANLDDLSPNQLSTESDALVTRLGKSVGDNVEIVEGLARREARASQDGAYEETRSKRKYILARIKEYIDKKTQLVKSIFWSDPHISDPSQKVEIDCVTGIQMMLTSVVFLYFLWMENGGAATLLLSIGAFNVQTLWEARVMLVSPAIAGVGMALACQQLPQIMKSRINWCTMIALAVFSLTFVVSMAAETGKFQNEAGAGFDFGDSAETSENDAESATKNATVWAWAMFGSLLGMMLTTAKLFETSIHKQLDGLKCWIENPIHQSLLAQLAEVNQNLENLQTTLSECDRRMESLRNIERLAVATARARFLTVKGTPALLLLLAFCGMVCDARGDQNVPLTKVIAISPTLDAETTEELKKSIPNDLDWLATNAPVGSRTLIIDAVECKPIADFRAIAGVPRIRKKELQLQLDKFVQFLKKPRQTQDNLVDFPALTQSLPALGLPIDCHVILVGSPLYLACIAHHAPNGKASTCV